MGIFDGFHGTSAFKNEGFNGIEAEDTRDIMGFNDISSDVGIYWIFLMDLR